MLMLELFSWWYTRGWDGQAHRIYTRITRLVSFFSIGILAKTLFDPFRQIDAAPQRQGGSLDAWTRAVFDRTFSRIIGLVVRSFSIGIGLVAVCFAGILGLLQLLAWPLLPLLPLAGLVLAIWGWTP